MIKDQRRARKESARRGVKARGARFEINPYYEQLLEMREKKPEAYRVMSAPTRLAVEAYVKAKEAAAERKETKIAA